MLFGVTFIFCLFAVPSVSVGDRDPVRGEIVEVRSDRLDSYYRTINPKEDSYLVALVSLAKDDRKDNKYGSVVPIIPGDASTSIFPQHLREAVSTYLNNENPKITGYFDLSGFHRIMKNDLKLIPNPTIMDNNKRNEMIKQVYKNLYMNGMPPFDSLELVGRDSNMEALNIKTGQVVAFNPKNLAKPLLGVAVCWRGHGQMAIIAILNRGKSKKPVREEIVGSDFVNLDPNNPTVTSGVFDLTAFLFIDSSSLKPQPAKFNDQTKFDRFVRTIDGNIRRTKAARQSLAVQGGDSSNGKAAGVSSTWKAQGANNKGMSGPSWRAQGNNQGVNGPTWRKGN